MRLAATVKPHQQPFEIRGEVDQLQTLATYDSLRVASGGAVLRKSVVIEKNQCSFVAPHRIGVPTTTVDGEFDDGTGVSAACDDDIEMNMKAMFVT